MNVTIWERVAGKLVDYQAEDGQKGRVDSTIDGTPATVQGILDRLGATEWEIHYADGMKSTGRRNPDVGSGWGA